MLWLDEGSVLTCDHQGRVMNLASQRWVTIGAVPVLVETDIPGRVIVGCPNAGPNIKPCTSTVLPAAGASIFVRVGGMRLVTDALAGLTDGTPPGVTSFRVLDAHQHFVGTDR
ncbi:hypothetical protein Rhe02_03060 [Rhizocola hellebori]|uniref:Uncharacterized protein n=1 Tax=Rhizocola hellebori TaxID=1392758 RepID=A0A8J3Q2F6_9ACTN|nr:hypothetical protein [Rhizocola hellebori]GIH02239.1 hypothetical protein Rhe02_03060 [Rhizocola hellebori]